MPEMKTEDIVRKQMEKWRARKQSPKTENLLYDVVTISVEPGNGGKKIGRKIAEQLDFDLFDRNRFDRQQFESRQRPD